MNAREKLIVWFQKLSIPRPPSRKGFFLKPPPLWKFQSSFIHLLKSLGLWKPPTPQEFPIPSVGGVWIFSGTTQHTTHNNTPKTMPLLKKHSCLIILMPNTYSSCNSHEYNEMLAPLKCHWLQPGTHKGLKRVTRVQCSWIFTFTIFGNLSDRYPFSTQWLQRDHHADVLRQEFCISGLKIHR